MKDKNPVASISIDGLFGTKSYELPMEDGIHIFVGENGSGKTTVVRLIRALISGDRKELLKFRFNKAVITFKDGTIFETRQSDLIDKPVDHTQRLDLLHALKERMSAKDYTRTRSYLMYRTAKEFKATTKYKKLIDKYSSWLSVFVDEYYSTIGSTDIYRSKAGKKVIRELNESLLPLPTSRIIEPWGTRFDSTPRMIMEKELDEEKTTGMGKVQKYIDDCLGMMKSHAVEGLSNVASRMINNLTSQSAPSEEKPELLQANVKYLLERVGRGVSDEVKTTILNKVKTGDLYESQNDSNLLELLNALMDAYKNSIDGHIKMKKYASICSSYLFEKEAIYDDKELEFYVKHKDGDRIHLVDLSSGEKQILYLFSELLLGHRSNNILLFDEPDLSLSIEWQSRYLEDIIMTDSCSLIIAATHSPFIFDNSLVEYTNNISSFAK